MVSHAAETAKCLASTIAALEEAVIRVSLEGKQANHDQVPPQQGGSAGEGGGARQKHTAPPLPLTDNNTLGVTYQDGDAAAQPDDRVQPPNSQALSQVLPQVLVGLKKLPQELAAANDKAARQSLRIAFIGRKGYIAQLLHAVGRIKDRHVRKKLGQTANTLKTTLTASLAERERSQAISATRTDPTLAAGAAASSKLASSGLDVTLPGRQQRPLGRCHPLTQMRQKILSFFNKIGFVTVEGRELESDYYNFEALNIPRGHPARASQDSFYINATTLLRTHTSNMQIRSVAAIQPASQPPIAIVSPGRVYRRDTIDATHAYTFHQLEGMFIDKNVSFPDLKGVLIAFCQELFGTSVKIRFRPDFFPFTEPSCEISIGLDHSGGGKAKEQKWLEILGAGLMNPLVLTNMGIDAAVYSGFAFGLGLERLAMIQHGINDIRFFHENKESFLKQFPATLLY